MASTAPLDELEEAQRFVDGLPGGPLDLFSNLDLPPFPVDLLPATVAAFAKDQGELIGVDPAVIGMAAIGAAAVAIDDRIEIQPKRHDPTWRESARLWVAVIGDPSAKKSPGLTKAMGPLYTVESDWRKANANAMNAWEQACEKLEKGEARPPKPEQRRLIVNDATVEKLGDIISNARPRGILSFQDELSGWLSSMDAYKNGGNKDRAAWLEAYNGGPKAIDRIGRGSTFVENWSVCVLGGIQPSVVHAYASSTNHDGMLQRFILVHAGEATIGQDRRPDMDAKKSYADMIRQLSEIAPPGDGSVVKLSEDAHKAREDLDLKLLKATRSHPNKFLAGALGKWNGLFARMLLTFHCIECATDQTYPTEKPVSGGTAQRVAALMWNTLLPHAVRFYDGLDPAEDHAREVAALLLSREWERFTVKRDLNRHLKSSRKLKPWELDETLDRLEAFGWIWPDDEGRLNERGRPVAYCVNALIHERFRAHAERERERRAEVAAMMQELGKGGNVANVVPAHVTETGEWSI